MALLFFSYSHADGKLRKELEKHLKILQRQGVITAWHDRCITVGEELHKKIDENLNAADVILLLISADFLFSDYCYEIEMLRAMERHAKREAIVIPVILRPCAWQSAPFGKLKATPENGKAVTTFQNMDEAFLQITKAIKLAVENFCTKRATNYANAGSSWNTPKATITPANLPDIQFNLNQLKAIYSDALKRHESTIAFELHHELGRFVFMMFFSEDKKTKDQLFIFLGRTQTLLRFKMYGNHKMKGEFTIYLKKHEQRAICTELKIQGDPNCFNFIGFLEKLNYQIPQILPLRDTVETLRGQKKFFQTDPELRNFVDDTSKIYLIGIRQLPPNQRPQEKTLRKLYLYVKADSQTIEMFVIHLKKVNCTLAWTDDPSRANNNILQMMKRSI